MWILKKYFLWSTIFAAICLMIGFIIGRWSVWSFMTGFATMFIVAILGVLETSLSFDNAIVNVGVLKMMDVKRRRRFLTWWILIAIVGMRVLFPVLLVSLFAHINPWASLQLAFPRSCPVRRDTYLVAYHD